MRSTHFEWGMGSGCALNRADSQEPADALPRTGDGFGELGRCKTLPIVVWDEMFVCRGFTPQSG